MQNLIVFISISIYIYIYIARTYYGLRCIYRTITLWNVKYKYTFARILENATTILVAFHSLLWFCANTINLWSLSSAYLTLPIHNRSLCIISTLKWSSTKYYSLLYSPLMHGSVLIQIGNIVCTIYRTLKQIEWISSSLCYCITISHQYFLLCIMLYESQNLIVMITFLGDLHLFMKYVFPPNMIFSF